MSFARDFPSVLPPLQPPRDRDDLLRWAHDLTQMLNRFQFDIAEAFQNIILEGTTAEKPPAIQSGRLYWDTTLNRLEYDDGSWRVV